ncbi:MAG: hypothetical protein AAB872_01320 [Patescibacteria group bacterium]
MQKRDFLFVFKSFVIWRVAITIVAILAIKYIPLSGINFFGGKYINYITNPLFYGWANFDGEHYLSIAMFGYKDLQQAFFPAYPILMSSLSHLFGTSLESYLWSGLIISNILFLFSLFLFWKIIKLDYSEKIAKISIILLLLFPTSFYFASVYTESLFLFSSLLTYYLYRKEKYLFAGIIGILMTLTRIYGLFILLMIVTDIIKNKNNLLDAVKEKIYFVGLSVSGLFIYMWYLLKNYNDPFAFYNLQTLVGEQRSLNLILLPQVFFRYFVKIIPNLEWSYFPVVFITLLETIVALLFLYLIVVGFKKIRWDYWVYIMLGYVTPTLTGSFSSLPRYVVVLFPAFIFMALKLEKVNMYLRLGIYILLSIITIIAQMLFFRGYFVS